MLELWGYNGLAVAPRCCGEASPDSVSAGTGITFFSMELGKSSMRAQPRCYHLERMLARLDYPDNVSNPWI